MCARRDSAQEMQAAAECLTAACHRKAERALRAAWDRVLEEPVPERFGELLGKLG